MVPMRVMVMIACCEMLRMEMLSMSIRFTD
jgi:hypothetical protein